MSSSLWLRHRLWHVRYRIGWRLMGVHQNWPYRGWRWKVYRLGGKIMPRGASPIV